MFSATTFFAYNSAANCGSCGTDAKAAAKSSQEHEIVTDLNETNAQGEEAVANSVSDRPQSRTYDQNTGLPDVVASDKEGEID
jgi:hypothetical protein